MFCLPCKTVSKKNSDASALSSEAELKPIAKEFYKDDQPALRNNLEISDFTASKSKIKLDESDLLPSGKQLHRSMSKLSVKFKFESKSNLKRGSVVHEILRPSEDIYESESKPLGKKVVQSKSKRSLRVCIEPEHSLKTQPETDNNLTPNAVYDSDINEESVPTEKVIQPIESPPSIILYHDRGTSMSVESIICDKTTSAGKCESDINKESVPTGKKIQRIKSSISRKSYNKRKVSLSVDTDVSEKLTPTAKKELDSNEESELAGKNIRRVKSKPSLKLYHEQETSMSNEFDSYGIPIITSDVNEESPEKLIHRQKSRPSFKSYLQSIESIISKPVSREKHVEEPVSSGKQLHKVATSPSLNLYHKSESSLTSYSTPTDYYISQDTLLTEKASFKSSSYTLYFTPDHLLAGDSDNEEVLITTDIDNPHTNKESKLDKKGNYKTISMPLLKIYLGSEDLLAFEYVPRGRFVPTAIHTVLTKTGLCRTQSMPSLNLCSQSGSSLAAAPNI